MNKRAIKAYASYFSSYLIDNTKDLENLSKIILFGSSAKNETNKESDVDIFIEVKKKTKKLEKDIENITKSFYKSREALLFKIKGIDNKINIIIGKLDNWKDLKKSIESTGILLYGKYISSKINMGEKKHIIFSWNKIKKNRGAFLNKLYGFNVKEKRYKGLIETLEGRKIGKSSIMIPIEHKDEIMKLLKHYKVDAKIVEVYV